MAELDRARDLLLLLTRVPETKETKNDTDNKLTRKNINIMEIEANFADIEKIEDNTTLRDTATKPSKSNQIVAEEPVRRKKKLTDSEARY